MNRVAPSLASLVLLVSVAACAPPPDAIDTAAGTSMDNNQTALSDDSAALPTGMPGGPGSVLDTTGTSDPATSTGTTTEPQVVYVNFDGPRICSAPNYVDDAQSNRSWLICRHFGVCSGGCINFAASGANQSVVMSTLRGYFERYNVTFTTNRPSSGPYQMLVISPTSGPHHGVGTLDCGNYSHNNIAFVYLTGDSFYPSIGGGSRAVGIAMAGAHELGHTFGLGHLGTENSASRDHMDVWSRGTEWTIGPTSDTGNCVGQRVGATQNAPAILQRNLGLR